MDIKRNPSITSLRDPEKSVSSKSVKRHSKKVDQSQLFLLKKGKKAKSKKPLSTILQIIGKVLQSLSKSNIQQWGYDKFFFCPKMSGIGHIYE